MANSPVGWNLALAPTLLLLWAAVYGFAAIGDSSVLSSAMTDAVPAERLGRVLGARSVLGIGAGAVAPVTFGMILDAVPGPAGWGYAYLSLGAGGLIALVCAFGLPDRGRSASAE